MIDNAGRGNTVSILWLQACLYITNHYKIDWLLKVFSVEASAKFMTIVERFICNNNDILDKFTTWG